MFRIWCLSVALLLLLTLDTSSLSSPDSTKSFRKSSLLPWNNDDSTVLGHCVEERDEDASILTVRIRIQNDDDTLTLTFPEKGLTGEGLASQLWPSAMASSILLRSPEFRDFVKEKHVVELGSGRGLAGLVAAADAKSCLLTDMDEEAVGLLQRATCPDNQDKAMAQQLDWRDDHRGASDFAHVVLGSDIAYYWHLLRPIMDTARAFMDGKKSDDNGDDEYSTLVVVGQANRESQWDLYNNIKGGCYNQLTDEDEPPWPGACRTLLYNLRMSEWCSSLEECEDKLDGVIPISIIVHHDDDDDARLDIQQVLSPFEAHVRVATKEDDESIKKSF